MSLPSRERELKRLALVCICFALMSLPSRERELKLINDSGLIGKNQSLPSRERELKRSSALKKVLYVEVAPFAGARVETSQNKCSEIASNVAPFTGA